MTYNLNVLREAKSLLDGGFSQESADTYADLILHADDDTAFVLFGSLQVPDPQWLMYAHQKVGRFMAEIASSKEDEFGGPSLDEILSQNESP